MTKLDIYGGQNPRDIPLYSVAEAARVVRVNAATLRTWVMGRSYPTREGRKPWAPLIEVADRKAGLLSFTNLVEVHVLSTLRDKKVRVDKIRSATDFIRGKMGTEHPLADVDAHTDCVDLYVEYLGQLTNASTSQTTLRPVVQRYLQRIQRNEHGLATGLFPMTRDDGDSPQIVTMDPWHKFGRPVLVSANIETAAIADRFLAGESHPSIARDFNIAEAEVEEAIRFEAQLRAA